MRTTLLWFTLTFFGCSTNDSFQKPSFFHYFEEEIDFFKFKWFIKTKLNDSQKIIFLVKIGDFNENENLLFLGAKKYISSFYKVEVLEKNFNFHKLKSRKSEFGKQFNAKQIFDSLMIPILPKNCLSFLAISNEDIYPQESFNYCFGKASFETRVAVVSFKRFMNNKQYLKNKLVFQEAFFKTITHEIGHNLKLKHCELNVCNMNAVQTMSHALKLNKQFCSLCQRKIDFARN